MHYEPVDSSVRPHARSSHPICITLERWFLRFWEPDNSNFNLYFKHIVHVYFYSKIISWICWAMWNFWKKFSKHDHFISLSQPKWPLTYCMRRHCLDNLNKKLLEPKLEDQHYITGWAYFYFKFYSTRGNNTMAVQLKANTQSRSLGLTFFFFGKT